MKKLVMLVAAVMAVAFVGLNYERIAYANDRAIPSIGVSGGVGSISVVWTTPAEAPYDYRLAWGLNGGYISYKASNTTTAGNAYPGGSATSYTISGLDPGTYSVKLKARYDGSAGPWKAASSVVVTGDAPPVVVVVPDPTAEPTAEPEPPTSEQQQDAPPTAPTGLMASQVAHDSVTLTWTAPTEAPYDYRLAWGLEGGYIGYAASNTSTAGNAYPGGSVTSYTITGLDPGTYSVKLRARYEGSAGPWKAASSVVVTGDAPPVVVVVVPDPTAEPEPPTSEQQQADPPAAPTGLMASQVAHDSVTLTWTAPSRGTVTGYRVLRGTDANSLSAIAQDTGSAGTEFTDSTVAAETTYFYAVLALSADGDGAQSAAVSATTPAAPRSKKGEDKPPPNRVTRAAPGVPLNLTAVAGASQLTFSWDPPTSDGGSAIIRYNHKLSTGGTDVASSDANTTSTAMSYTYTKTGLTNGTQYTFHVRAINMSGGTVTTGTYATVNATPRADPEVTVWFEVAAYNAAEGGSVWVAVRLSADPDRTVAIPITTTNQGGASAVDYSVPASLTFNSGETSKTFRFSATQDTVDDDDESVKLGFGTLPAGVIPGRPNEATVNIADDDVPAVTVQFTEATKSIDEGSRFDVVVTLSADPERTVEVNVWKNHGGGVSNDDYFMGFVRRVTFMPGETRKHFGFFALRDGDADPNESVTLRLALQNAPNVTIGTPNATTITINDVARTNYVDFGEVNYETHSFPQAVYTVQEGQSVEVKVLLRDYPRSSVTIPIMKANWAGASDSDYSGVPDAVTFNTNEKSKTFTFMAINDSERDHIFQSHATEQVFLYFGNLPPGYRGGASRFALITINDDD